MRIAMSSALLAAMLLGGASTAFASSYEERHETGVTEQPNLMNDNAPVWSRHGIAFWKGLAAK